MPLHPLSTFMSRTDAIIFLFSAFAAGTADSLVYIAYFRAEIQIYRTVRCINHCFATLGVVFSR